MSVRVRRLRADETVLLRTLRLAALRDSPDAFGRTLADALAQTDSYWSEIARGERGGVRSVTFVAEDGGRALGIVFGIARAAREVDLAGMWVAPEGRARGVGRALGEAVLGWARDVGCDDVVLWVTDGNEPARALYERLGFVPTGKRDKLASNPALEIVEMRACLDGSEAPA